MKRVRNKSCVRISVKAGDAAPTAEELSGLLRDLPAIMTTHPELYGRMYRLIGWLLLRGGFIWQQKENCDWMRHTLVRHHLEAGVKWDAVFETVAAELQNSPAAAGPDQIEKAYKRVERRLPRQLRRVQRRGP